MNSPTHTSSIRRVVESIRTLRRCALLSAMMQGVAIAVLGTFQILSVPESVSTTALGIIGDGCAWQLPDVSSLSYTGAAKYIGSLGFDMSGCSGLTAAGVSADGRSPVVISAYDALTRGLIATVPEPAAYAVALAGLAFGGFSMLRRREGAAHSHPRRTRLASTIALSVSIAIAALAPAVAQESLTVYSWSDNARSESDSELSGWGLSSALTVTSSNSGIVTMRASYTSRSFYLDKQPLTRSWISPGFSQPLTINDSYIPELATAIGQSQFGRLTSTTDADVTLSLGLVTRQNGMPLEVIGGESGVGEAAFAIFGDTFHVRHYTGNSWYPDQTLAGVYSANGMWGATPGIIGLPMMGFIYGHFYDPSSGQPMTTSEIQAATESLSPFFRYGDLASLAVTYAINVDQIPMPGSLPHYYWWNTEVIYQPTSLTFSVPFNTLSSNQSIRLDYDNTLWRSPVSLMAGYTYTFDNLIVASSLRAETSYELTFSNIPDPVRTVSGTSWEIIASGWDNSDPVQVSRMQWINSESLSHIINTSNLVLENATLFVPPEWTQGWWSGDYAKGVWLTDSGATGGIISGTGSIVNIGEILCRGTNGSVFRIDEGISIVSPAALGASNGRIQSQNGGVLQIRGVVDGQDFFGFSSVEIEDGGRLGSGVGDGVYCSSDVTVRGSALKVGWIGKMSGSLSNHGGKVVLGGDLHVSGELSVDSGTVDADGHSIDAISIAISGSGGIANAASLSSYDLSLSDGAVYRLTGADTIGWITVGNGATLTMGGGRLRSISLNGGTLNADGGRIEAEWIDLAGAASVTNATGLTADTLLLNGGHYRLTGDDAIGWMRVEAGGRLTTSSGTVGVGDLSIYGGDVVLGADLSAFSVYVISGSMDAAGHDITARDVSLGGWGVELEAPWSIANIGRITASYLSIRNGDVSLRGGVVDSLYTDAASIDLRLDATSDFTTVSAVTLTALDISPGGVLRLNSFNESFGADLVGLRWTGGDHSAVLSEYLLDGRIAHRDGLGDLRIIYDAEASSTLIIDPFTRNVFTVEAGANEGEVYSAPIKGNTAVVKTGPGSLTLSGSNSHYAGTTVEAGRVIAGGAHAFGTGNVVVNGGTLDLASMPVANPTTIVSGSIVNAENYQGYLTLAGPVSITGTVGGSVSVGLGGMLRGSNTTFTGTVWIESEGQHSPGNSPGSQTFTAGLAYSAGSNLNWELIANTTAGAGTNYDFLSVTGGSLTIDSGALLNLIFSGSGSTVSWSDSFWSVDRSWTIIDASAATSSTGEFLLGTISTDSLGQSLGSVRPNALFALDQSGSDVVLTFSPVPEPATVSLALAGLALGGFMMLRRRREGASRARRWITA